MRTTLTIDDDVAALLQQAVRETGRSFKEVVNEALRAGLTAPADLGPIDVDFPTYDLQLRPGLDLLRAGQLAAELEDEELVRKLELRK
jgi:hypothetical protein